MLVPLERPNFSVRFAEEQGAVNDMAKALNEAFRSKDGAQGYRKKQYVLRDLLDKIPEEKKYAVQAELKKADGKLKNFQERLNRLAGYLAAYDRNCSEYEKNLRSKIAQQIRDKLRMAIGDSKSFKKLCEPVLKLKDSPYFSRRFVQEMLSDAYIEELDLNAGMSRAYKALTGKLPN